MKSSQFIKLNNNYMKIITDFNLNSNCLILFTLLADRKQSSLKQGFVNEANVPYVYFSLEEVSRTLNCSISSAKKYFDQLEAVGLVSFETERINTFKIRRAIYLNESLLEQDEITVENEMQNATEKENKNAERKAQLKAKQEAMAQRKVELNSQYEQMKIRQGISSFLRFKTITKENSLYKSLSYKLSHYKGNVSQEELADLIAKNIDYTALIEEFDIEIVDYLVKLMTKLFFTGFSHYNVFGTKIEVETILETFLTLRKEHIAYLLMSLKRTTTKVSYQENYFISALYSIQENMKKDNRPYYRLIA